MSTASLREVFSMLFTEPAEATVNAERQYRRIWIDWLQDTKKLTNGLNVTPAQFEKTLSMAPVMTFRSAIEVGVTMRVASVSEHKAGVSLGLTLSVIEASGSYGFMNRNTQESVFQARARYEMGNREFTIKDYLGNFSIDLAKPGDIDNAITFLERASEGEGDDGGDN